jgi:hypothetical protein
MLWPSALANEGASRYGGSHFTFSPNSSVWLKRKAAGAGAGGALRIGACTVSKFWKFNSGSCWFY